MLLNEDEAQHFFFFILFFEALFNCSLLQQITLTACECFKGLGCSKSAWFPQPLALTMGKTIERSVQFCCSNGLHLCSAINWGKWFTATLKNILGDQYLIFCCRCLAVMVRISWHYRKPFILLITRAAGRKIGILRRWQKSSLM